MALQRDTRYPGRYDPPSPQRPQGGFKNRTTPTSKDGSYFEKDWINDWDGFFSSLLDAAQITPNNQPDEVGASQYFDALKDIAGGGGEVAPLNGDWNGFFDPEHQSLIPVGEGLEYPKTSDQGGTTYGANDQWSFNNFSSAANNQISSDTNGVIFSIGIYKKFTFTAAQKGLINLDELPVYIVDETGKQHFLTNTTNGVNITSLSATEIKVELTNAIFNELGITKVWQFFVTTIVAPVPWIDTKTLHVRLEPYLKHYRQWVDVTASRTLNTDYENDSPVEIIASVRSGSAQVTSVTWYLDGQECDNIGWTTGSAYTRVSLHVPAGGTYSAETEGGYDNWSEYKVVLS